MLGSTKRIASPASQAGYSKFAFLNELRQVASRRRIRYAQELFNVVVHDRSFLLRKGNDLFELGAFVESDFFESPPKRIGYR